MGLFRQGTIALKQPEAHKLLWVVLLCLTMGILLWPITPSPLDPLPIQSISAISDLPLFVLLFGMWTVLMAALLFLSGAGKWELLALCLVFSLVFVGFWGFIAAPWGNSADSSIDMGHVNYLLQNDHIPAGGHPVLHYFDFPGLSLLGASVTLISGADLLLATRIYTLVNGIFFAFLLFGAFSRLLKTPYLTALTVVLAILSSKILGVVTNQFHPISLATIYLLTFILLVTAHEVQRLSERRVIVLLMLLAMAASIGYMPTPVFFAVVLFAIYLHGRATKIPRGVNLTLAIFSLTLFISWEVYWTVWNLDSTLRELPNSLWALLQGGWLIPAERILGQNFGPNYTWWGNITRAFWWGAVFGFGTLLVLRDGLRWRRADGTVRVGLALFTGVVVTLLLGSLIGGSIGIVHGVLTRYLWLGPFVLTPPVVMFLSKPGRRALAGAFVVVSLVLVVPTFLTNGDTISTNRVYRNEISAFEFVSSLYGRGNYLTLYSIETVPPVSYIYVPESRLLGGSSLYGVINRDEAWFALQSRVQQMLNGIAGNTMAYVSIKGRQAYRQYLGIPVDDPHWLSLDLKLSTVDRVYDNGDIQLYEL